MFLRNLQKVAVLAVILAGCLGLLTPHVHAQQFDFPDPVGYVNDFANVLSNDAEIDTQLRSFDEAESTQILVITVNTLPGDVYLEEFVPQLTDQHPAWRAGQAESDNGVIFTIVVDTHAMRIAVGYGLEGALPDVTAKSILDNEVRPKFRLDDYDGGVQAGVSAIMAAVKGEYTASASSTRGEESAPIVGVLVTCCPLAFFIVIPYMAAFLGRTKSWWLGGALGFVSGLVLAGIVSLLGDLGWMRFLGFLCFPLLLTPLGLLFDFILSKTYKVRKASGQSTSWARSWGGFSPGSGFSSGGFGGGSSGGFSGGGGSFGGGGSSSSW